MNLDHVHVLKVSSFYDQRGVCEFRLLRKRGNCWHIISINSFDLL